jgi:hypothetical protein
MKSSKRRGVLHLSVPALALLVGGCVQVDVTVALHENDGGATITERLRLSRKLQDACTSEAELKRALGFLSKERALERTKSMGKGVTLASHKTSKLPDGSLETVVVYKIPEVEDLRLHNPMFETQPPSTAMRLVQYPKPIYKGSKIKHIVLEVKPLSKRSKPYPQGMIKKAVTPAERQVLRELRPLMLDMLDDFRMRVRVEVPTRFTGGKLRNIRETPKTATLFSLSGRNRDAHGNGFFENEEILIALLRMDLDSGLIDRHTNRAFLHNGGVPVFRGSGHGLAFVFYPTRHLAKKFLNGKLPAR